MSEREKKEADQAMKEELRLEMKEMEMMRNESNRMMNVQVSQKRETMQKK
jgi:hypothetical protein